MLRVLIEPRVQSARRNDGALLALGAPTAIKPRRHQGEDFSAIIIHTDGWAHFAPEILHKGVDARVAGLRRNL